jgi:hypothetical protein
MLTRPKTLRDAICFHEAGYLVAARVLGIPLHPTQLDCGLRRYDGDVINLAALGPIDDLDKAAVVFLAGRIALRRYDPDNTGDNDEIQARDLIFGALRLRFGKALTPDHVRSHMMLRMTELTAQAERLVAEHWPAIEVEAARLRA